MSKKHQKRHLTQLSASKPAQNPLTVITNPQQYTTSLNRLLNKISIQNNYSNRITISNVRNQQQLVRCKQQLHQIQQIRANQQLKDCEIKDVNSRLEREVKQLKDELAGTRYELIKAKQCIKKLKIYQKQLQQQIIGLSMDNFMQKKIKLQTITNVKQDCHAKLLSSVVTDFLVQAQFAHHNILVEHCRQCVIQNKYDHFLDNLNQKLIRSSKIDSNICPRLKDNRLSLRNYSPALIDQGETFRHKSRAIKRRTKTLLSVPMNYGQKMGRI